MDYCGYILQKIHPAVVLTHQKKRKKYDVMGIKTLDLSMLVFVS